jgi:hypothetical protein
MGLDRIGGDSADQVGILLIFGASVLRLKPAGAP